MQNDFHAKSTIENKKYRDPLTSVLGSSLQGRGVQWKREKRQKKGKTTKNVQIVSGQFKGYCTEGWALWTGKIPSKLEVAPLIAKCGLEWSGYP